MLRFVVMLIFFLFSAFPGRTQINHPTKDYCPTAKVNDPRLNELSGIVRAATPGQYWGHNDSDDTTLYRFNDKGEVLQRVYLKGVVNLDWEGMTKDDRGFLYLGEIGDNDEIRPFYSIHKFLMPGPNQRVVEAIETCSFTYSDNQSHNCEALFFFQNHLYLITRKEDPFIKPALFRIDRFIPKQTVIAHKLGEMDLQGIVSDAAYSAQHNQLAILTYHGVYFFPLHKEEDLLRSPSHFIHSVMGWTEAVCYDEENLIVTDEPGYLFKKPLTFWQSQDTFLPSSFPMITLPFSNTDPALDGDLGDWKNDTLFPMQFESYSKYQGKPEINLPDPDVHLLWTSKGLYIGFTFSHANVHPNFRERLMVMFTTEAHPLFLTKDMPVLIVFLDQAKDKKEWHIDDVTQHKQVGQVSVQVHDNMTTVEALVESKNLPEFKPGATLHFNIVKFERNRKDRKAAASYWATRASFIQNHPDLWGTVVLGSKQ